MNKFQRFLRNAAKAAKTHQDSEFLKRADKAVEMGHRGTGAPKESSKSPSPIAPQPIPIHPTLEKEGVPSELSRKMHNVVAKSKEPKAQHLLGKIITDAINNKRNGNITSEGLTKIIEEAISEHEKGVSFEELHDIISEVLKSELNKVEFSKERYHEEHPEAPIPEKLTGGAPDVSMPIPTELGEKLGKLKLKKIEVGENLTKTNMTYPLIYSKGKVHVYANIRYDPTMHGLLYKIIEPQLNPDEQKQLKKIEDTLIEELEVDFSALKKQTAEKYLFEKINSVIDYYGMKMTNRTREIMDYFIKRDFIGLSGVEPMFQDPNIEDISCDGTGIPIYVYHRDPRFGSLRTTVQFPVEDNLNSFVMKLAQRCGRSISVADPLLDGALPDGSRVQATFGTGISMKGSNFTIRKFTKDPLTFVDLVKYGTVSAELLAYLWLAMEHNKSVLIAGPTACGKTTMLNALSLFIRPELKIVSIEDTPELRLPHENWISQVARTGFGPEGASGKKLGEISLFDLLKASLRQRPDEIIVGEVRGKEAAVLFQQIATGHPGMSTIHAESMEAVINRLVTPPIELPASLVQHLDVLLVMTRQRMKGKYIRRIKEAVEVTGFDTKADRPFVNTPYTWAPADDKFSYSGKSGVLKEIMEKLGTNPEGIFSEIDRRVKVIEWLVTAGVRDFKNVGKVVSEYYQNPQAVLDRISTEKV
jgi:flagellar protein FlaI|tara:strand:- start:2389 stop:4491 length:2103 start_codon:yes stop_codon:yes gene_type:complete